MPHDARNDAHNRLHARLYYNLDKARAEATQKNGYNSESTRNVIQLEFLSRFGRNSSFQLTSSFPQYWSLPESEAIDCDRDSKR